MSAEDLERLVRIRALVALEAHGASEALVTIDDLKWLLDQLDERKGRRELQAEPTDPNELQDKIARESRDRIMAECFFDYGEVFCEDTAEAIVADALDEYAKKFTAATLEWDRTNERRVGLIRKEIANQLDAAETQELQELQTLADFRVQLLVGNEEAARLRADSEKDGR